MTDGRPAGAGPPTPSLLASLRGVDTGRKKKEKADELCMWRHGNKLINIICPPFTIEQRPSSARANTADAANGVSAAAGTLSKQRRRGREEAESVHLL